MQRPSRPLTIEICIDSVESAIAAVKGGANRLELCANLGLGGGTTPSLGLFNTIQRTVPNVPIMVMIRPRTGDFLYSEAELEVMLEDIRIFKAAGANGVVFGALTKEGNIDVKQTKRLVNEAIPIQVCFHRAFDMTNEPLVNEEEEHIFPQSVKDIASIPGVTRILTSGRVQQAPSAIHALRGLLQHASTLKQGRDIPLVILPGSGINPTTVGPLVQELLPYGLEEIHLSAGGWVPSIMEYKPEGMGMGVGGEGEWGIWRTNEETVNEVRLIVDKIQQQFHDESGCA